MANRVIQHLKMSTRKILHRVVSAAMEPTAPLMVNSDRIFGRDHASINSTARLYVLSQSPDVSLGHISFGRGAYIGRHVELAATRGGIEIDNDTSIQDFGMIYGDVQIGAHCLFAMHAYVASTSHRFRDRPEWLIRDQDAYFSLHPEDAVDPSSRPVQIEDDCWVGRSAVVLPGVYVGRGAIIGANCVVTSDVAPYEIHGGVPNRKVSVRLGFDPPPSLSALEDEAIPYFYRGFVATQEGLRLSRQRGVIEARRKACLILRGGSGMRVRLNGLVFDGAGKLCLRLRINGSQHDKYDLEPGPFNLEVTPATARTECGSAIPTPLAEYTCVELETISQSGDRPGYEIASASVCFDGWVGT